MYRSEYESIGYPIALHSRDHSVVLRFLLTEFLHVNRLVATLSKPDLSTSEQSEALARLLGAGSALGALEKLDQLTLLYRAPTPAIEEVVSRLRAAIDQTKIYALRLHRGGAVNSLGRSSRQMALPLRQILASYLDDENVLLFLLRHADSLDAAYGLPMVSRLLKRGFGNLAKARLFLEERYRSRGFHHVMPSIGHGIAQLERKAL